VPCLLSTATTLLLQLIFTVIIQMFFLQILGRTTVDTTYSLSYYFTSVVIAHSITSSHVHAYALNTILLLLFVDCFTNYCNYVNT
jgi:hypothetical protein